MNLFRSIKSKIVSATIKLIEKGPFYGNFVMDMSREKSNHVDSLGLSVGRGGVGIQYSDKLQNMTTEEISDELVHNIHHLVHGHIDRVRGIPERYKNLAGLAADITVNDVMSREGFNVSPTPKELGLPSNGTFEAYFDKLKSLLPDQPPNSGGSSGDSSSGNGSSGSGESPGNEPKEDNKPKEDKENKNGQKKESDKKESNSSPMENSSTSSSDTTDSPSSSDNVSTGNNKIDKELEKSTANHSGWQELEKIPQKLMEAIVKTKVHRAYRKAGGAPSHLQELIDELLKEKESVDWRRQLHMFAAKIASTTRRLTWKRTNKRYGNMFPGRVREWETDLVVILDTSGSISIEDYLEFKTELKKIASILKTITIIECDAAIQKEYKFKDIGSVSFTGRGGTLFSPAITRAKEIKPGGIVYFTDGYPCENWPKEEPNLLWVICSEGIDLESVPSKNKIKVKREDERR